MNELVRKTYGETVSHDPETGKAVETPPELKTQLDAALEHALDEIGLAGSRTGRDLD